ncbi:MAG: hypothetical protein NTV39_04105 [Candidatus Saccharibacteria bacterium]|nr:hypothetical protein [Candidatus Saccharibacteria bacterium]
MRKHVKDDKFMILGGLICAIIALFVVDHFVPAHVETTGSRIVMVVTLFISLPVGAAIGGSIGWVIDRARAHWALLDYLDASSKAYLEVVRSPSEE